MDNQQSRQDAAPTAPPQHFDITPSTFAPSRAATPNPSQGWIAGLVALGLVYVLPITIGLLVEFNGPVRRETAIATSGPGGKTTQHRHAGAFIRLCTGESLVLHRDDAAMLINDGIFNDSESPVG